MTERADRWRRKMRRAVKAGDSDAALRASTRLLSFDPDDSDAHFFSGICHLTRGDPDTASTCFARAAGLEPSRADYWAQYAHCLEMLDRHGDALAAIEWAQSLPEADALTRHTLGSVLSRLGRFADAVRQFDSAVRLRPDNTEYRYQLAQALLYNGDLDRARSVGEETLRIDPQHARTHLLLAELLDGPPPEGRLARLEAALEMARGNIDAEVMLSHALARTAEAAGDTARAFAVWESSKAAKQQASGYDFASDAAIFAAIEAAFDPAILADQRSGHASRAPIFVIGMPRTGTTLVERILSSHSSITAGGELVYLPRSVSAAWADRRDGNIDAEALAAALAEDPRQIATRYLDSVRPRVGATLRFVDKLPLNFFFVGFIRRSLPNAKIICLHRGALDTCLANFRQLFALQYPQYRYSLSLSATAEYFARFERLMARWDELWPGAIHQLHYERLVTDPEAEIRSLFEYLELGFEPGVLQFEKNPSPVATASAVQVRQPLHAGSIDSWRRYEQELQPVRQRLLELGVGVDTP